MKLRTIFFFLLTAIASCANETNELVGTWKIDCRQGSDNFGLTTIVGNGGEELYYSDEITFTENKFASEHKSYLDSSCETRSTPEGEFNYTTDNLNYSLGEKIITLNGEEATRFKGYLNKDTIYFDIVYKITENELVFGKFIENSETELDYRFKYIKQLE